MGDFIVNMCNAMIAGLGKVLSSVLNLLPPSPFEAMANVDIDSKILGGLMWIVPISEIVALMETWVSAIALYYVVMIVLRWIKAIE